HPSMKPFGLSFQSNNHTAQSNQPNMPTSTWYKNKPGIGDKVANELGGLTLFTQSDYQTLQKGNMRFVVSSIYPVEKGFVASHGLLGEKLIEKVMGIGANRINYIQKHNNYYADAKNEYDFLMQLNDVAINIDGQAFMYRTLTSGKDIEKLQSMYSNSNVIINVISIEGGHALNCGLPGIKANTDDVLANVEKIRKWTHRPFFITLAHHFYNELCGHARSLHLPLQKQLKINQNQYLDTGINPLGFDVINAMLQNRDGCRILVDIKHMSRQSRLQYFEIAKTKQVPIIASHAGVTGLHNPQGHETIKGASKKFMTDDINFYDDEIIAIAASDGLIGIQLDERRMASNDALFEANTTDLTYRWEKWAELLWRQFFHIAQVLDNESMYAWDCICIGSDFDGLINPIGPYWTAAETEELYKQLLKHASQTVPGYRWQFAANNASPKLI
ncbi:MAG TPA: membrane dipeptidase, partial [Bacteroidia bacterium]|nr:membrane dipeptidase [Bacteroidia bacterium]